MESSNDQANAGWYYERAGQKMGPVPLAQMAALASKGVLSSSTLVWRSGLSGWVSLERTELVDFLGPAPSSTAAVSPATPPTWVPAPAQTTSRTPQPAQDVPAEVRGWCWGGFLLSWIWAIRFRFWWGLLALVPWAGIGMMVYLGLKGREQAWRRGSWESVEVFNQVQRRWSVAGVWLLVLAAIGGGIYGFMQAQEADWASRPAVLQEETDPVPGGDRITEKQMYDALAVPAVNDDNSRSNHDIPSLAQVEGTQYRTRGGSLVVQGDSTTGRQLLLNGQPVPNMREDFVTLVSVYRYQDRDTAVVTYACAGSICGWTSFALVEVFPNGQFSVLANDQLTIEMDGAVPDVAIQNDGSLSISFQGHQGREQWRYAKGQLTKQ